MHFTLKKRLKIILLLIITHIGAASDSSSITRKEIELRLSFSEYLLRGILQSNEKQHENFKNYSGSDKAQILEEIDKKSYTSFVEIYRSMQPDIETYKSMKHEADEKLYKYFLDIYESIRLDIASSESMKK